MGLAVGRRVHVAVVAHRQKGLQGVAHHARHRHGDQAVGVVVLKHVASLAMQQQHGRLRNARKTNKYIYIYYFICPFYSLLFTEECWVILVDQTKWFEEVNGQRKNKKQVSQIF